VSYGISHNEQVVFWWWQTSSRWNITTFIFKIYRNAPYEKMGKSMGLPFFVPYKTNLLIYGMKNSPRIDQGCKKPRWAAGPSKKHITGISWFPSKSKKSLGKKMVYGIMYGILMG
jgi:hypothetical protein